MRISVINLTKKYRTNGNEKTILDNISFNINSGDRVALVGPSGSGKTTLLNILCTLDKDYEGTLLLDDKDVKKMSDLELSIARNKLIGYVFQEYALIETSTAKQNIGIPLIYSKIPKKEKISRLNNAIARTECSEYINQTVNTLSGGERQRVAIARAYVNEPKIFIADEPIGSVDDKLSERLIEVIIDRNPADIIILSTHQLERVKDNINKIIEIKSGKVFVQNVV